jgi:hypothetical protein
VTLPLHERLRHAADRLPDERIDIATLADAHGPAALGTLLVLTALPCMLPLPGTGTVLGTGLALLALAMWRGHDVSRLPPRVAAFQMPRAAAQRVLRLAAAFYEMASRVARERWPQAAAAHHPAWLAPVLALMALLIILPIPFGNVLPAMSVSAFGLALVYRDHWLTLAGIALAVLAVLFAAGLAVGAWVLGVAWLGG